MRSIVVQVPAAAWGAPPRVEVTVANLVAATAACCATPNHASANATNSRRFTMNPRRHRPPLAGAALARVTATLGRSGHERWGRMRRQGS